MTAAEFVADAHANGHRGEAMLRRWARVKNSGRRGVEPAVTRHTLNLAVELEAEMVRAGTLGYRRVADALGGWVGE